MTLAKTTAVPMLSATGIGARDQLLHVMTKAQIAEAEKEAKAWKPLA